MSKKIFICGSIIIHKLAPCVKSDLLNEIVIPTINSKGLAVNVLVGDAKGVDNTIQNFLRNNCNEYPNIVTVCSSDRSGPRRLQHIDFLYKYVNPQEYSAIVSNIHEYKDIYMCDECDELWAIWDGHSRGTLKNIKRCIVLNKPVRVYRDIDICERFDVTSDNCKKFIKESREEWKKKYEKET